MHYRSNEGVNQRKRSCIANDTSLSDYNVSSTGNSVWSLSSSPLVREKFHNSKEHRRRQGFHACKVLSHSLNTLLDVKKQKPFIFIGFWCFFMIISISSCRWRSTMQNKKYPVVLGCHFSTEGSKIVRVKHLPIHNEDRYPSKRQVDWSVEDEDAEQNIRNSKKYDKARAEKGLIDDHCSLPYRWQKTSHPTCNSVHEQKLTSFFNEGQKKVEEKLLLFDHGFFRDIWIFKGDHREDKSMVIKTLRYIHEYTDRNFERHRRDAVVMNELTSSEHVANIYSFCGNSIFTEYATEGTVSDIIWPLNGDNFALPSNEKLKISLKIAQAIRDMHSRYSDNENIAVVAHTDISPSQFLHFDDGSIKLNDFNRCRFLRRDDGGQICPYKVGNNPGKFRSPEEYDHAEQTEKVDIYSMGNVFYSLLTGEWPFESVDDQKVVQEKVKNGERPPIMSDNSNDQSLNALVEIIHKCWEQDFNDRPSASDVVSFLEAKIKLVVG